MFRFKDLVAHGTITNMVTGESRDVENFILPNNASISVIARIEKVESYVHPDGSLQISVNCHALDCIGSVFPLRLSFTPETVELRDGILRDLQPDLLFYIFGELTTGNDNITVHDAEYRSIEEELVAFAREAFRVNFRGSDDQPESTSPRAGT